MSVKEGLIRRPPEVVRWAARSWVVAVAAGAVEMVGTVAVMAADGDDLGPLVAGVALRMTIYALVLLATHQLWKGRGWARWVLAIGLGVFGTLSLVAQPLAALAEHGVPAIDLQLALVTMVRTVHVGAVLAACVLMFRPAAGRYLSRAGS